MAAFLGTILGPFGVWAYGLGFWAAVFASLLGVWQSVPYLYADIYGVMKGLSVEARAEITKVTSRPYRLGLIFISLVPLPLAFTGAPLLVIVHLHGDRQPVRALPGGDAALPEQPRRLGRSGRAEERAGRPTCCSSPSWCCSCSSAPRKPWARSAASSAEPAPAGGWPAARSLLLHSGDRFRLEVRP